MNMNKEIKELSRLVQSQSLNEKQPHDVASSRGYKTSDCRKTVKKGDVLEASTIAIQAVKETPRIIPHCHPIH